MSHEPVRRAGNGQTPAGDRVTWVVAEGRRGRRWREVAVGAGGLRHSLLLETAPDGTFEHLELATPTGLLTLHPEPDGTLHGNAVTAAGVRHVVGLPWDRAGLVEVEGSPMATAAAVWLVAGEGRGPYPAERRRLRIRLDLVVSVDDGRLEQVDVTTWRFAGGGPVAVDPDGLPDLAGGGAWSLEAPE
jgi:hypothetical protein